MTEAALIFVSNVVVGTLVGVSVGFLIATAFYIYERGK